VVCGKNGVCSNLWMLRTVDELVWSGKLLLWCQLSCWWSCTS
jgi:hypothetical protein